MDAHHCPPDCWHVWEWFLDLDDARPAGLSPISYADLDAWARLTGASPDPDEVRLIRIADRIFLAAAQKAK